MNRFAKAEFSCFVKGFIAFFALSFSVYFTTCDMPMGLGDPIDWEPPVLTVIPTPPNPMYVRQGAVLSGTVTDNVKVDRVIMRDANTLQQLFQATINGDNWEIVMTFTEEQNDEKIAVEIIAWDRAGNTGDQSMAALTLIVDIGPPIIEDIWIQRTEIRKADLERYSDPAGNGLFELETIDRLGERSANIERYQNGFFHIAGKVAETETRIEILSLNIYDADSDPNTPLMELKRETSSTDFSPRWLISEEALLDKGEALWPGYKNAYYNENKRYYYRVSIIALDRSRNENSSEGDLIVEDQGYFVMWQNADIPKGILDPVMGVSSPIIVTKGSTLPVEFFDDDQLLWAYTGLLTIEQWRGEKIDEENGNRSDIFIADGIKIPEGDDQAKLEFLRNRLRNSQPVFNWEYDRYTGKEMPINDVVAGQSLNEKIVYVQTGNSDLDNGEYILFTLVADKKLAPHTETGPYDTNRTREMYRVWRVDVIDENEPLIVFDTVITTDPFTYIPERHPGSEENETKGLAYNTGDSPEDNTFPKLTDGQYFTVNGYTLRANKQGTENEVVKFRMAWIPFGIGPGETPADNYIAQVQRALSALNYPASFNSLPSTIQHWEFEPVENAANPNVYDKGKLLKGTDQKLDAESDDIFRKQVFQKTFDLLGGPDDLKGITNGYYNFRPNGSASALENETKLFVFYAEDNMGHVVYRQLRLLGNKTPPTLAVYDITGRDDISFIDDPRRLPNLNNDHSDDGPEYYFFNEDGNITDEARRRYEASLALYQPYGYQSIVNKGAHIGLDDSYRTEPYTAYPRDTIVKYWVTAARSGDLFVENISMRDITYSTNDIAVGYYNTTDALSYVEMLPEVTQRVFLFEAKDTLGNNAQLQRTVAVTNAAVLNNITTATQNGPYGIGQTITLQANFSNLVEWTGPNPPLLNVRHNQGGTSSWNGSPVVRQIATKTPANTQALFLEFDLVIEEGYTGNLETMYFGMDIPAGNDTNRNNRPITLPTGTRILDATRKDDAFTPRNSSGFDWTASGQGPKNSLQGSKTITLDGIRPEVTGFTLNPPPGKKLYTDGYPGYYFKTDETIQFTLTANKSIFTSTTGEPIVEFQIGSSWINAAWQRASGTSGMVFSVLVNSTNTPIDGTVTAIRLKDVSKIVDSVGNAFNDGSSTYTLWTHLDPAVAIHVDKNLPAAAGTTLTGTPYSTPQTAGSTTDPNNNNNIITLNFNVNPTLAIGNTSGENAPVEKTQYSLNNGVTWVDFPKATDGYSDDDPATDDEAIAALGWTTFDTLLRIRNGQWTLVTRYIDRAGNIGAPTTQPLHVNATFPNLIAVTAVQPAGWYKAGADLQFKLDFSEAVRVQTPTSVQIVLTNRGSTPTTDGSGINNMLLQAAGGQTNINRAGNTTIIFDWTGIDNKEMRDGMYISYIRLSGLMDNFANSGPGTTLTQITYNASTTAPSPIGAPFASPQINNLGVTISNNNVNAVKVDAIAPTVSAYSPVNNTGVSSYPDGADKRNVITLTFSETVQKGSGTITIKPKSDFLIPPVFEDNGYYMDCVTEARDSASSNRTIWMPGFYDIYNNNSLNATDRNRLTESTTETSQRTSPSSGIPSSALDETNPSMTRLRLDARTGQPVGPYVKTTQGLKSGYGYSGLYNGGNNTDGNNSDSAETAFFKNGPNTNGNASGYNNGMPAHSAMIPDTATKWVLAYQYSIHDNASSQEDPAKTANGYGKTTGDLTGKVSAIRDVLVKTKFRWQEIDVAWSNVVITTNASGQGVVTITLSEPLLKGLQWELSYPGETFTDQAGNNAAALAGNTYTFWSEGVQKPVIRVNRKSYDARTANWHTPRGANEDTRNYTYAAPLANSGWNIADFNTVDYRIESETPGASITYGVTTLLNSTTTGTGNGAFNAVSVTGGWTGAVPNVTAVTNQYTQDTWNRDTPNEPRSFWVRPNLIRRDGYSGGGTADTATVRCRYYVNGDIRYSAGTLRMFRSYNRDVTLTTANGFDGLNDLALSQSSPNGWYKGTVSFDAYEAGKRYVVATASRTGQPDSNRGYEGVFRTLIVLNGQDGRGSQNNNGEGTSRGKILVEGSNIKAGLPSVAGFPVQDGSDTGDSRFAKMMFNVDSPDPNANIASGAANNQRFYWVSTEIVCEWYFVYFGNGGNYMRNGDVNNYMMVSYGDLTYGYHIRRFPD